MTARSSTLSLAPESADAAIAVTAPRGCRWPTSLRALGAALLGFAAATTDARAQVWTALGSGANNDVNCLTQLPNGDIVAGGLFTSAGGSPASRIARWDGSSWTALGSGANQAVHAAITLSNGDLLIGGAFTTAGGQPANRIARWNGSAWSALGPGLNGNVLALAQLPNGDIVVGGAFSTAGGTTANRIARWNGASWSPLGTGLSSDVFSLASMPNGDIVAGGRFLNAGGPNGDRIARWNGASWLPLGTGMNDVVNCLLTLPNGDLVAGGEFDMAGGVPADLIARWNGVAWSSLAGGLSGTPNIVAALAALPNGDLVAGGDFSTPGNSVARWDGATWSALGSGISNQVFALAGLPNGDLMVGGDFNNAGGTSASRIARYGSPTLQANFTGTPLGGLVPLNVSFTDTSIALGSPIASWAWDFNGDALTDSTAQNANYLYTQPGSYAVRLTVTNALGTPSTLVRPAYINATPPTLQANFTGAPLAGLAPLNVQFTNTSTASGSPIVTRAWDLNGDGLTDSTAQNPSYLYTQPGAYTVSLTVTNALGTPSTLTRTAYVNVAAPTLQANFIGAPLAGFTPLSVQFTNTSTASGSAIVSRAWDFDGDGLTDSTASNPSHLYTQAGSYTVSLTVTNALGTPSTLTRPAYITATAPTLQAAFTGTPVAGLAPLNVTFTDASIANGAPIMSWAWDFNGDGLTDSNVQHPATVYSQPGAYTVSLTVTNTLGVPSTSTRIAYIQVALVGDECATAETVFVGDTNSTTVGCTPSVVATGCGLWGATWNDRWFRFVPAYTYSYRVSVPTSTPQLTAVIELRSGDCGGTQATVGCGSEFSGTLYANTDYYIRVGHTGPQNGAFTLRVRPADDECAGATPIVIGTTATANGTDYSSSAPMICGQTTVADRWFQFTPPISATYTVATYDTCSVEVLFSCGGASLACGSGSTIATMQAGLPYLVRLGMSTTHPSPTVTITPGSGTGTPTNTAVFNELVYDDAGSGNEFIELFRHSGPTSLAGYQILAVTATTQTTVALAPPNAMFSNTNHFVFGTGGTPLLAPLPDGTTSLRLYDAAGQLLDTLAYEGMAGALPAPLLQGHTLFGEHVYNPTRPTSWSRDADGHLTPPEVSPQSDNGLEWRVMTPTRGLSNDQTDLRSELTFDYEGSITTAPNWNGSQGPPAIGSAAPLPYATAGQHAVFAAPQTGGGSFFYETAASDNFQLDGWFWFDLPQLLPGQLCTWSVGLCGTTDSNYLPPDPWRERGNDQNGDTGVTWTYEVSNPGTGTFGRLSLVDNEAGGTDHLVLWSTSIPVAGWYRLGIGVSVGTLSVRYGGNVAGTGAHEFERPHYAAHGGVYVGIRKSDTVPSFALRIDDTILNTSWNSQDTTGPGCDGNCPPRNSNPGVLDRSVTPAAQTFAILITDPGVPYSAQKLCFYMAARSKTLATQPQVSICPAMTATSGALVPGPAVGTFTLHADDLDWWVADLPNELSGEPYRLPTDHVFYVLDLPEAIQPPVVLKLADGSKPEDVPYRTPGPNGTWSDLGHLAFALKWQCANGSSGLQAKVISDATIDTPTLDFRLTTDVAAPQIVALVVGLTPLQLDLGFLGAPTCKLFTTLDSVVGTVTAGSAASFPVLTPPGLPIGLDIHSQWGVFDPSYNAFGLRTTNRHTVTVR